MGLNTGRCRYCRTSLRGRRIDARYCSHAHQVADYRRRLAARAATTHEPLTPVATTAAPGRHL